MSRFLALTRRELMAYFFAPVPYLLMFLFLLLTSFVFWLSMSQARALISYQMVFEFLTFSLLFLIPLLTMNTVAEERARNTLETLLTAPVQDHQVILSKWLATFAFYVLMLLPTLVYWPVLAHIGESIGRPATGPILAGYLGALMLGGMYISIGIFASSLTENALLSAFMAFFISIGLLFLQAYFAGQATTWDWVRELGDYISPGAHFDEFRKGRISVHDTGYFLLTTGLFLFLAVRALESRKWR